MSDLNPQGDVVHGKRLGFRRWVLADGKLAPISVGDPWEPGVNTALCQPHKSALWRWETDTDKAPTHRAPQEDCECGLYGLHDADGIERLGRSSSPFGWTADQELVAGALLAWGEMIVHPTGFRAQHAEVMVLAYSDDNTVRGLRELNEYGKKHGIPVVKLEDLAATAAQFGGLRVPKSMCPEMKWEEKGDPYGLSQVLSARISANTRVLAQWQQQYVVPIHTTGLKFDSSYGADQSDAQKNPNRPLSKAERFVAKNGDFLNEINKRNKRKAA